MALALNNLKRVDMPLNKETKPNQYLEQLNSMQIRVLVWKTFTCMQNRIIGIT